MIRRSEHDQSILHVVQRFRIFFLIVFFRAHFNFSRMAIQLDDEVRFIRKIPCDVPTFHPESQK